MNAFPLNTQSLSGLVVASLPPMTPPLLAVVPLKQLFQLLMKILIRLPKESFWASTRSRV